MAKVSKLNKLIKNILANIIGRFWSVISNFIFVPLYISILGFDSFSIISFTLVIAGFLNIFDSGLTATLSREFARADESNDKKVSVLKTLDSIYLLISLLIILICFLYSDSISTFISGESKYGFSEISWFVKLVGFDIAGQMLLRFYIGGLIGLEKQVTANVLQVIWSFLRNGLVIAGIMVVPTLEMFFIWQAVSTISCALFLKYILHKNIINGNPFSEWGFQIKKVVLKHVGKFAGGMFLISLVSALNSQLDKLIITEYISVIELGYYTLAVSISMGLLAIVRPISIALLPRFTALYTSGEQKKARHIFNEINSLITILVLSVAWNIFFNAESVLYSWTGNSSLAENSYEYLEIIIFSGAFIALQMLPYNIAISNGVTKLNNIVGITSLVLTVPGYIYFTKEYGAIGTSIVFCTANFIITIVYNELVNRKFIRNGVGFMWINNFLIPATITLILSGFIFYMSNDLKLGRWEEVIRIGLSVSFSLVISIFLLKKKFITQILKKKLSDKF